MIIALILVCLSILYYTLKLGISPMPSSKKAREKMAQLLDKRPNQVIYELGSGWGGLAILLAKRFPEAKIEAYELSIIPWLWSCLIGLRVKNLKFHRKDFLKADLRQGDLVCYLFPKGMALLKEKLIKEGCEGRMISSTFALPEITPEKVYILDDLSATKIYSYSFNLKGAS